MRQPLPPGFTETINWQLYRKHGMGTYTDWLELNQKEVTREDVLTAAKHPATRECMLSWIKATKAHVEELLGILAESA